MGAQVTTAVSGEDASTYDADLAQRLADPKGYDRGAIVALLRENVPAIMKSYTKFLRDKITEHEKEGKKNFLPLAVETCGENAVHDDPCEFVYIIGDVHGSLDELWRLITNLPEISNKGIQNCGGKLVFLGDYADKAQVKGDSWLTTFLILFLQSKFPRNVVLLRGNHETLNQISQTDRGNTMSTEWNSFEKIGGTKLEKENAFRFVSRTFFPTLPLAVRIYGGEAVGVHGGFSERLKSFEDLQRVNLFARAIVDDETHAITAAKEGVIKERAETLSVPSEKEEPDTEFNKLVDGVFPDMYLSEQMEFDENCPNELLWSDPDPGHRHQYFKNHRGKPRMESKEGNAGVRCPGILSDGPGNNGLERVKYFTKEALASQGDLAKKGSAKAPPLMYFRGHQPWTEINGQEDMVQFRRELFDDLDKYPVDKHPEIASEALPTPPVFFTFAAAYYGGGKNYMNLGSVVRLAPTPDRVAGEVSVYYEKTASENLFSLGSWHDWKMHHKDRPPDTTTIRHMPEKFENSKLSVDVLIFGRGPDYRHKRTNIGHMSLSTDPWDHEWEWTKGKRTGPDATTLLYTWEYDVEAKSDQMLGSVTKPQAQQMSAAARSFLQSPIHQTAGRAAASDAVAIRTLHPVQDPPVACFAALAASLLIMLLWLLFIAGCPFALPASCRRVCSLKKKKSAADQSSSEKVNEEKMEKTQKLPPSNMRDYYRSDAGSSAVFDRAASGFPAVEQAGTRDCMFAPHRSAEKKNPKLASDRTVPSNEEGPPGETPQAPAFSSRVLWPLLPCKSRSRKGFSDVGSEQRRVRTLRDSASTDAPTVPGDVTDTCAISLDRLPDQLELKNEPLHEGFASLIHPKSVLDVDGLFRRCFLFA
ncbi:unnamed protein product [Amoebophrya sp. A120]|nr:unnamed protein product [Amoebophrya sp. A120]|eukprot:GSA120T00008928001.1